MTSIPAAICRIFCHNFKRYYLNNGTHFLDFLLKIWNVREIFNILKKRMRVLAYLFPKLLFRKDVATETSRKSSFRTPFGNHRVKGSQTPLKVARHHYYHFSHEFQVKSVGKTLLYCDHKSEDCLLTHWLPMTCIPAATCRYFYNIFKRSYLKNGRLFLDFLLHFWNVHNI